MSHRSLRTSTRGMQVQDWLNAVSCEFLKGCSSDFADTRTVEPISSPQLLIFHFKACLFASVSFVRVLMSLCDR